MIRRSLRACAYVFAAVLLAAVPARAASITVAPGALFGYIPLTAFGVTPSAVATDGVINFNTQGFVFGGETWSRLAVAENGLLILGGLADDATVTTNQSLPASGLPNAILAPYWTDLSGGELYAATLTDGVDSWIVVDWQNMTIAGGAHVTFQAWIGVNGTEDITFAYPSSPALPSSGLLTIGAQDKTGQVGTNYYYNGTGTRPTSDLRVTTEGLPVPPPVPVPEPATMTMLAGGLVLGAIGRLRNKTAKRP